MRLPIADLVPIRRGEGRWNVTNCGFRTDDARRETRDGRDCLAVAYPRGSYKPGSDRQGGVGFYASPRPAFPSDAAELRYSVFFDPSFDWVRGGKLPGLYLGRPGASGGRFCDDAASCRVMWRAGGDAEAYVYPPLGAPRHPSYDAIPGLVPGGGEHGDSLWRGFAKLRVGAWNDVRLALKLNSLRPDGRAETDGTLSLKINGVERRFDRMVWRTSPDARIGGVVFHTFFGGADPSWATPRDAKAWFADVCV